MLSKVAEQLVLPCHTSLCWQIGIVEDLIVDRAFISNRQNNAQVVASFDDLAHLSPIGKKIPEVLLQDAMLLRFGS